MKKISQILLLFVSLLAIQSCSSEEKKEKKETKKSNKLTEELAALKEFNKEYEEGLNLFEDDIVDYQNALKEIELNLASLDESHELVLNKKEQAGDDQAIIDEINLQIEHINTLLLNSKHKVGHLNKSLDHASSKESLSNEDVSSTDEQLKALARKLHEKDAEIGELHQELRNRNEKLYDLSNEYTDQQSYSEVLLYIIQTKFYIIGTEKDLIAKEIVNEDKTVNSFGRKQKINPDGSDALFKPINGIKQTLIEFQATEAVLLSAHPQTSYEFVKSGSQITGLKVLDYQAFWDKTEFLIIQIQE